MNSLKVKYIKNINNYQKIKYIVSIILFLYMYRDYNYSCYICQHIIASIITKQPRDNYLIIIDQLIISILFFNHMIFN